MRFRQYLLCLLLLLVVLSLNSSSKVWGAEAIRLQVNGEPVELGRAPLLEGGRLLIPVRLFAEAFGAIVHWEPLEQSVTISANYQVIRLIIGESWVQVGDQISYMDVPARLDNEVTYVPLRFLGEALGVRVDYYQQENLVTASYTVPISIGSVQRLTSGVELKITASGRFTYTTMILTNPDRYVLDLQNTVPEQTDGTLSVNIAGISTIRYHYHETATPYTRVVLDLEGSTQGLNIMQSSDGKLLTIQSRFYYINTVRNQRLGSGEELTLTMDGRIAAQMEGRYLNGPSTDYLTTVAGDRAPQEEAALPPTPPSTSLTFPEAPPQEIQTIDPASPHLTTPATTPSTAPPEVLTTIREYTATTLDYLNFRSGPGFDYDVLNVLPEGTVAIILQRRGEWALLRLTDGSEGWCHIEFLEMGQRDVPIYSPGATPPSNPAPTSPTLPPPTLPPTIAPSTTLKDPNTLYEVSGEFGHGSYFAIFLPGVFPQLPANFVRAFDSLITHISLLPGEEGSWLNIGLVREMTYQVSVLDNQLEIALNLETRLSRLSFTRDASGSTVSINLSRSVGYEVNFMANPSRVEITITGAAVLNIPAQQLVQDGLITQILTSTSLESAKVTIELDYLIGYRVMSARRSDLIEIKLFTRGLAGKTVYLDPGHGGSLLVNGGDPGAISYLHPYFHEATGTLDIALRLKSLLEQAGVTVLLTRSTDAPVDIRDRVSMINASSADILVSIHHNSATNQAASGAETFYWSQTPDRLRLAQLLQQNLVSGLGLIDRGVKRSAFYPINQATMPGALVEVGFLSNAYEGQLIRDPAWRARAAEALFAGIAAFFE
ncbi:MAG: N-acetylmuramoyl-L-alanine amidase [Symbiobacteriaceae bacterium]|nr:N-acetylmuramoyl-L-alanine amidase [Symbiobacteriaceae bacterium]